jgi:hypothetical protein
MLWTGIGASLAIARAAAATFMQLGRPATAALPDAPHGRMVHVHVSRSAAMPMGLQPDLLLCEAGARGNPWAPRLEVPAGVDPHAWVPLDWVEAAALRLREELELTPWRPEELVLPPLDRHELLMVTDAGSEALQSLSGSVRAKVPELDLSATATSELGHGWHARLARRGGTVLYLGDSLPQAVAGWIAEHAPTVQIITFPCPVDPLATLALSARLLATLGRQAGLDLRTARVTPEADWLRRSPHAGASAKAAA